MVHRVRVGWLVGRDTSTRNHWWIYALLYYTAYCIVLYGVRKQKKKKNWWAELPSYDIKIDRIRKQRKHREVYIIQTKSHLHSFHIYTLTEKQRKKQYGNQAKKSPSTLWSIWLEKFQRAHRFARATPSSFFFFLSFNFSCYFEQHICFHWENSHLDNFT